MGNAALLEARGIAPGTLDAAAAQAREQGQTAVLVAVDGKPVGAIAIADAVKTGTLDALHALHSAGPRVLSVSGDHRRTAEALGREPGIDEVHAQVSPARKADIVDPLRKKIGRRSCRERGGNEGWMPVVRG